MRRDHYLEDANLSVAWARALRRASAPGQKEVGPLIISVTGFNSESAFEENHGIRSALDALLANEGKQSVDTVANTIFPVSMWNPEKARQRLFDRYTSVLSRIRGASHKNTHGTYFGRMITGGPKGYENQLDFAIATYLSRTSVRRSILQIGVFDPSRDHSASAQRGFPCMQHVTFAPVDGGLCVNAFYATQYLVERAYGNYVGLCRLGRFAAHELGVPLTRMTCFTGIAECEMSKNKVKNILSMIDNVPDEAGA
jgi:hypothetical protein